MGMFDHIEYETPCPFCNNPLSLFQSKSGPCLLLTLQPKDVRDFYTFCDQCKGWVEYEVVVKEYEIKLSAKDLS